jgi:hypothetical protein
MNSTLICISSGNGLAMENEGISQLHRRQSEMERSP